jgi:hypothetical protein
MLRATILSILLSIGLPNICYSDNKLIKVDLTNFHWEAFINNQLVREGKASGGRKFCPDIGRPCKTPSGTFKVISKKDIYTYHRGTRAKNDRIRRYDNEKLLREELSYFNINDVAISKIEYV